MLHHARRELSELLTVVTTALMLACRGGILVAFLSTTGLTARA